MSLETVTTCWAWDTNTASLAASTQYAFPAITVEAPTASRTVRSAVIKYTFYVDQPGAVNITSRQGGVQIDAVGAQDNAVSGTVANTGDHSAFVMIEDLTSYFVTNFTGSSHSVVARWRQVGGAVINLTAELSLTYEYDNAGETTRIKTATILLESPTDRLTDTLTEIGTNQVPRLIGGADPELPEASPTILDCYFIVQGNLAPGAVTDMQLGVELDTEGETLFGALQQDLITSVFWSTVWKRDDIDPNAAHAFRARSTVTSRFEHLTVWMVVTYSHTVAGTTRTLNSIRAPMPLADNYIGGTASTDNTRQSLSLSIPEPGTVTLRQSGIVGWYSLPGLATGLNVRSGAQAYRAYTKAAFTDPAGPFVLGQRIDAGSAQGAALTLARGPNTITLDHYRTSTTVNTIPAGWSSMVFLNYHSDVAAEGLGAHSHTTEWAVQDNVSPVVELITTAVAPIIPEASYAVTAYGLSVHVISSGSSAVAIKVDAGSGLGFAQIANTAVYNGDTGTQVIAADASCRFARWPGDPDTTRLALETARTYRLNLVAGNNVPTITALLTYHALTFAVAGSVTGYTGDGSGITIGVHKVSTGELIATATTSAGGAFSAVVYDDTQSLYCEARQDATHVGRSDNEVAS